jgi:uncharacterized metal-binding protein
MACACGSGKPRTLVYACSGAANTGLLADQVARKLNRDGSGDMTCLAGLGADLSGFRASAVGAGRNLVIDGCAVACGAKIFGRQGLAYRHVVLTARGVKKGETVITPELVERIGAEIAAENA